MSGFVYISRPEPGMACFSSRPFRLEFMDAAMRESRNWEESAISVHISFSLTLVKPMPTLLRRCQYTKARAPRLPMAVHRGER